MLTVRVKLNNVHFLVCTQKFGTCKNCGNAQQRRKVYSNESQNSALGFRFRNCFSLCILQH